MRNGDYILVVAPQDYPGKKYRDRYCFEHYLVWWKSNHYLPSRHEVIHHINKNTYDNRIENLMLMNKTEHNYFHGKQQICSMVILQCPHCGVIFERRRSKTWLAGNKILSFCSQKCSGYFFIKENRNMTEENLRKVQKQNIISQYCGVAQR